MMYPRGWSETSLFRVRLAKSIKSYDPFFPFLPLSPPTAQVHVCEKVPNVTQTKFKVYSTARNILDALQMLH